jgi:uncharacterized protein (DUF58 family)
MSIDIFNGTPYQTGVDIHLDELLSYKQQEKLQLQPKATASYQQLAGNYLAKVKGRGMEFAEVRHYQPGDDVRTIDWSVTARTGKAHTKLFHEEKERPVFILLDLSDSMIFGSQFVFKSVQACHLAALLSWQAKQRGDRLGGIVFNQKQVAELKPTGRSKGLMRFLHQSQQLCLAQPFKKNDQQQPLQLQLKRLSRLVQTGSQIHLISDFSQLDDSQPDNNAHKLLTLINRHNQINAWQISDPLEQTLPKNALKNQLQINSLNGSGFFNPGASKTYQTAASERQQKIQQTMIKHGIPLYKVCASLPLMEQFHVPAR